MRIVIDLQAAQSMSRLRGVGRYALSLAEGIVRLRGEHEVIIALSGLFPSTIVPLRAHFSRLLPPDNIRVWYAPSPVAEADASNIWRAEAAKCLREAFLARLRPDVVLLSSLFEGHVDNSVTSIHHFDQTTPTAVILYDLIPLLYPSHYLARPEINAWYNEKIGYLKQANLILAISASAKEEVATAKLTISAASIINISSAASDCFKKIHLDEDTTHLIRARYQLHNDFLMYTGGIDHRKNIEGLIRCYALLPASLKNTHQLAIVCSIQPDEHQRLTTLLKQYHLTPTDVLFLGYVPDEDLVALYNLCKAFIFPSLHEGFGLPLLEAMLCGAPVIGSNSSSIPEVINYPDALFNPLSDTAIAAKIEAVLTDATFRERLITHGKQHAKTFSWDKTAKTALLAMEALVQSPHKTRPTTPEKKRPTLAYLSPLPPEKSGIAIYSAMLLPALAEYYDIEVIVDQPEISDDWIKQHCPIRDVHWFLTHADTYDRVLYHMGNSTFHAHLFDLIKKIPGVVVLHDFYLSGILAHLEHTSPDTPCWSRALYHAHGYQALAARYHTTDLGEIINQYPCNQAVIHESLGLIVHANEPQKMAQHWLGDPLTNAWFHVPLLRLPPPALVDDRDTIRARLNLNEDSFVVCSFGFLASTKLSLPLLEAWLDSTLVKNPHNRLIFVGESEGPYGEHIRALINKHQVASQVMITGWISDALFSDYLSSADLGVQLRTGSRGEASAAVLDCMVYGVPTLVNAHGSLAELPNDCVWKLADRFDHLELVNALNILAKNDDKRLELKTQARDFLQQHHTPASCANRYFDAIETCYAHAQHLPRLLTKAIAAIPNRPSKSNLLLLSESISINKPPQGIKQLFIDISHWKAWRSPAHKEKIHLRTLLNNPPTGYRIEPIYRTNAGHIYCYARKEMLTWLGCPSNLLEDTPIFAQAGDCYLTLNTTLPTSTQQQLIEHLARRGILLYLAIHPSYKPRVISQAETSLDAYLMTYLPRTNWKRQFDSVR